MSRMFCQNVKGQDMGYEMIFRPQDLKGKSKKDAFKSEGDTFIELKSIIT